jgi:hypothetical protein
MNAFRFAPIHPAATKGPATPPPDGGALAKTAQNLLAHIPGEASGFYLLAIGAFTSPPVSALVLVAILAFVLLVLVRWAAKASRGVMITSAMAFVLWMLILDNGVLHVIFPSVLPPPMGFIVAAAYSSAVTILANAGKLS